MTKSSARIIKLALLCVLATGINYLLNTLCIYILKIPLFLDTVFTAAVSFTAGFVPGIITALLTWLAVGVRNGSFDPFLLCSISEVLIICWLMPVRSLKPASMTETTVTSFAGVIARLMLLYIVCCIAMSILGGLIDFFYYKTWSNPKLYFSAEDTFKIGLLRNGTHVLIINILSRIPVNIVDRFIVIFGGYFISWGIKNLSGNSLARKQ